MPIFYYIQPLFPLYTIILLSFIQPLEYREILAVILSKY